jgi:hypothetical protein
MKIIVIMRTAIFLTLIAFPQHSSGQGNDRNEYQPAAPEAERLDFCIEKINQKLIHRGMKVSDLDRILDSQCSQILPKKQNELEADSIKFSDSPLAWRLVFYFDRAGLVQGYYLTNMDSKHITSDVPLETSVKDVARKYCSAKSDIERLRVSIDALNRRVIPMWTAVSDMKLMFGPSTEHRHLRYGEDFASIHFSKRSDTWRLSYFARRGCVAGYYLTNMDCKPWSEASGASE